MSKSSNKSKSNSKQKQQPLRVAVRCSWSGARLAIPSSSSATTPAITAATSLTTVIATLVDGGSLPPAILDDNAIGGGTPPSLVYARTAVPRDRWGSTTLGDLVGGEGSGGSGGIMLVLNLGGGGAAGGGGGQGAAAPATLAPASAPTAAAPKAEDAADATAASTSSAGPSAAATATSAEPMEIDATSTTTTPTTSTNSPTPTEALQTLLSSNFDSDLRPCLTTLIRILDNVISKPHEPKVRTIKLSNPAFSGKVGRCRGGVEVLVCCGFERRRSGAGGRSMFDGGGSNDADAEADVIVLPQESDGDDASTTQRLVSMRHLLAQRAVQVLGMDEQDLPKYKGPPRPVVLVAGSGGGGGGGAGGGVGGGSRGGSNTFDPYRTHSYNAQAAASGAADPHAIGGGGGGISRTEKELNALKSKQERLERRLQKLGPGGRALAAFRPGTVGSVSVVSSPADDHGGSGGGTGAGTGKGDGSLLAARMKRLEEERRKREEGGFTTKAMRDLESMKKAKVYTHATLRIGFADGCWVTAKFLPSETVEAVRTVLREECFREDMTRALDFDLYVAPPRRKLDGAKRLDAEGLVPAARVHVSWKVGGMPPAQAKGQPPGSYLREELFQKTNGGAGQTDYNAAAFPNAQKLVEDDDKKEGGKKRPAGNGAGSAAASAESREEALMARMLGKKPGLLGGRSGGDAGKKKSSSSKPKWFK